ncbi:glycoside hydrolase family 28 protein [Salipiger sp. PrR002]|uniref:polygalacturonase PglA n=1 Tax=Salipiger sp. PrR002 TaxID=2706489 RepID=UPI0013B9D5B9|nr:glycoside hydrolase family 28 protein [Salipiger sp. PrR002]NDW00909.1 glycoside hydrolase family 28 protein [Salipiger sp. PrR002]NDW57970.1 glycoside hydrolase family 28 protein [Salipiger sp. PrR004]
MSLIRCAAVTPRMAVLCLAPPPARYTLSPARPWRLRLDGQTVAEGSAATVVLPLGPLQPGSAYTFDCGGETLSFTTPPCPGALDVTDFGARDSLPDTPEAAAQNAAAFARAIAALPKGGTLIVPAGHWLCGPVELRSDMILHLSTGATLAAPSDRSGWPILPAHRPDGTMLGSWEGLPEPCFRAPLHAIATRNLTIEGFGTLDGGGDRGDWWTWAKERRDGARRPRGLHLIDAEATRLIGFTIRNAPSWTIHPQGCRDLFAACLSIQAPHDSPNTDGFDPDMCEDVTILGTHFSVGDDCIAIKAGKRGDAGEEGHLRPTRRVTVQHCLMERGHGGCVIGSEMSGDVTDVTICDCEMVGTDRGLRLKTRRGRGGRIERIAMRNVTMDGVLTAFSANAHYYCDHDGHADWVQSRAPAAVTHLTPHVGEITAEEVEIRNLAHAVGAFLGLPEAPIGPIRLSRITLLSHDAAARPEPPLMADGIRPLRHAGVLAEHAEISGDLAADPAPLSIEDVLNRSPALP